MPHYMNDENSGYQPTKELAKKPEFISPPAYQPLRRFAFKADMERGHCYDCPLCEYNYYNDVGNDYCSLTGKKVPTKVPKDKCPLEEI